MPNRGRDVFRSVTSQAQEDFKVETGSIWLHYRGQIYAYKP